MCLGDWRLGRMIRSYRTKNGINATPVTYNKNAQRVGIQFSADATDIQLAAYDLTINGFNIWSSSNQISTSPIFTLVNAGELPTLEWVITVVGGNLMTISVVEWFLPESVLQTALESIQSEYKL
jgi:hypothetical protein